MRTREGEKGRRGGAVLAIATRAVWLIAGGGQGADAARRSLGRMERIRKERKQMKREGDRNELGQENE